MFNLQMIWELHYNVVNINGNLFDLIPQSKNSGTTTVEMLSDIQCQTCDFWWFYHPIMFFYCRKKNDPCKEKIRTSVRLPCLSSLPVSLGPTSTHHHVYFFLMLPGNRQEEHHSEMTKPQEELAGKKTHYPDVQLKCRIYALISCWQKRHEIPERS